MNFIEEILNPQLVEALAYTFLHSLWIGIAVASILIIVMQFSKKAGPVVRYNLGLFALATFLLGCILIFIHYYQPINSSTGNYEKLISLTADYRVLSTGSMENMMSLMHRAGRLYERIYPVLVVSWLSGILLLGLRFTGGIFYNSRLKKKYGTAAEASILNMVKELSGRLDIKAQIEVRKLPIIDVPAVSGFIKPVVILPLSIIMQIPHDQLQAVLAHELAHIKRHDHLVNLLQNIIEVIFFYHPAVSWISAVIRKEREEACDDIAVEICGNRLAYARALIRLEEFRQQRLTASVAFTGQKNTLVNRLKRLMMKKEGKTNYFAGVMASALVISVLTILSVRAGEFTNHTSAGFIPVEKLVNQHQVVDKTIEQGPDTLHLSSSGRNQTMIINTSQDGKQLMIRKEDGNLTRLEVDGEVIDPENYDKYEDMIRETEQEIEAEGELRLARQQEMDEKRIEMREMRQKMQEEREIMLLERKKMLDSLRAGHLERAEMHRREMKEANQLHKDHLREMYILPEIPEIPEIPEFDNHIYFERIPEPDNQIYLERIPEENIVVELERKERAEAMNSPGENIYNRHTRDYLRNNEIWNKQISRQRLLNELYKDDLIQPYENSEVYLTNRELIVNGEKQPRKIMKKYRELYEALSGEEIGKNEIIEIQ